ncbi:hypothetical protein [Gracilibacillus massiliensis]|uniref:hypothetical protein n=1 Tax=Gracilibacillus massiliensis TaxID=1564956 RepID=UPI000ADF4976|nr:hypothetical protein [Gracilibacillus massiliensis]
MEDRGLLDNDPIKKEMYQKEIIEIFEKAGIKVEIGKQKPINGRYSGIISRKGERVLNI